MLTPPKIFTSRLWILIYKVFAHMFIYRVCTHAVSSPYVYSSYYPEFLCEYFTFILQLTVNGSMDGVVVVQPPAAVEQRAVHQSLRSRYSTEEENALTLFTMESHDCLSALIFYLAHLVR